METSTVPSGRVGTVPKTSSEVELMETILLTRNGS